MKPSEKNKTKIMMIIPALSGGGAEKQFIKNYNCLKQNYSTRAIVLSSRNDYPNLTDSSFRFLGISNFYNPINVVHIWRIILREKPTIVYSWLPISDILVCIVNLLSQKSVFKLWIAERTSYYEKSFRNYLRNALIRISRNVVIVSNNKESRDRLNYASREFYYLPNILDLPEPRVVMKDIDLLYVGRLHKAKNIELLASVIAKLSNQKKLNIVVVGEGKEVFHLTKVSSNIVLESFSEDIYEFFERAKVFISLSLYEGVPNTVLEAAHFGCKLILSNIQEHKGIVGVDYKGLVNNDKEVIAKRVLEFLEDESAIDIEGISTKYSKEIVRKKYIEIINQTL